MNVFREAIPDLKLFKYLVFLYRLHNKQLFENPLHVVKVRKTGCVILIIIFDTAYAVSKANYVVDVK